MKNRGFNLLKQKSLNYPIILDVTMGHRGMQKEVAKQFRIFGTIISIDIRSAMGNGMKPDIVADSCKLPFYDDSFDIVLFDPPFSFRNSKSCGSKEYVRFYITYGLNLYTSRTELQNYIKNTFYEIARVVKPNGTCLLKWSESRIPLNFPLELLPNKLIQLKKWSRPSKHFGTKSGSLTWYVELQRIK